MVATATTDRSIEIWFEFGSPYSYLSVMRIAELATAAGVRPSWQPFLLGPIFRELGWQSSPFLQQPEKCAYMWVDMARQCRKHGLAWMQPTVFPRLAVLPLRVALLCRDEPWIGDFCSVVMIQSFAQDRDVGLEANVAEVLTVLEQPAASVIAAAQSDANKLALRHQTERARQLGIFGAPTFRVASEMFWGNDRLDDALAFARER